MFFETKTWSVPRTEDSQLELAKWQKGTRSLNGSREDIKTAIIDLEKIFSFEDKEVSFHKKFRPIRKRDKR